MQVSGVGDGATRLRGAGVGAVSTTLAVAAHATAGGMLPDVSALLLLLGLGTVLGAAAATLPWLRSARLGLPALLGAGQLAGHLLLGVTTVHAHPSPSAPMVAAHAGAVAVAAVLVGLAERAGPLSAAALARVLPAATTPLVVPRRPVAAPVLVTVPAIRRLLVASSLARRGPPFGV